MSSIVPIDPEVPIDPNNPRIAFDPSESSSEPLRTTGLELGWRFSNSIAYMLPPYRPTSRSGQFVAALEQRVLAVGINTILPGLSVGAGCLALGSRSIGGFVLNSAGAFSHAVQALDPQVPQLDAHRVAEVVKYLYRAGFDAAMIFGVNESLRQYLILAEAGALLINPGAVRSFTNRFFRSLDALVDTSVTRLFGASRESSFRIPISDELRRKILDARAEEPLELELKPGENNRLEIGIRDASANRQNLESNSAASRRLEPVEQQEEPVEQQEEHVEQEEGRGRLLRIDDGEDNSSSSNSGDLDGLNESTSASPGERSSGERSSETRGAKRKRGNRENSSTVDNSTSRSTKSRSAKRRRANRN